MSEQQQGGAPIKSLDDVIGRVRDTAGKHPVTQRLFSEAEQYVQTQGKQWLQNMAEGGQGGAAGGAIGKGVGELMSGGSPMKALAEGAKGAIGNIGKGKEKGQGQRKATVISENVDVGVPVTTAYNQWTQLQEFGNFLTGVEGVQQKDEVTSQWRVKVGPSRRMWEGTITEAIPDRRIAWDSHGPKGTTKGVVTFHPLCDDLTRVCVVIEYYPGGFVEKVGNMFHLVGRRVRLDLQLYRRFIMMQGKETGEWRGEVRDGQVVQGGEQGNGGDQNGSGQKQQTQAREGAQQQSGNGARAQSNSRQEAGAGSR